jgi:hypothetical protein
MNLTAEIKKAKRGLSSEKRCWFSPKWNTIQSLGHIWSCKSWVSVWIMARKVRHTPKTFMGV